MFLVIKQMNKLRKPAPAPVVPATKDCPYLPFGRAVESRPLPALHLGAQGLRTGKKVLDYS